MFCNQGMDNALQALQLTDIAKHPGTEFPSVYCAPSLHSGKCRGHHGHSRTANTHKLVNRRISVVNRYAKAPELICSCGFTHAYRTG
jgi:hypothetical protein